jgi:hypothetical protein
MIIASPYALPGIYPKELKTGCQRNICIPMCKIIQKSQKMEATQVSTTNKQNVNIHSEILFGFKKESD